jgi:hypothetical protein
VPIFLLLEILHVWQFLRRHFLLIIVVIEPESNKTFSKILDFTEEMVSTTMIVTGVSCFGLFLLDLISIASLALICTKLVYTSSVMMLRTVCVLVPVKNYMSTNTICEHNIPDILFLHSFNLNSMCTARGNFSYLFFILCDKHTTFYGRLHVLYVSTI